MHQSVLLSAVIITFNEEKNIRQCLESLLPVADDIVVLDSFSTDNTPQICRSLGVRFEQQPFEGYVLQKNRAVRLAKYPYILSLDADEHLSPELQKSILATKQNWVADGYYINRLNNYCGHWIRHSGWYPDRKIRLWNSQKGQWRGIEPHDTVRLQTRGCTTARLQGDLLHYSYRNISEHIQQSNRFSDIKARTLFEDGRRVGLLRATGGAIFKFFRHYVLKSGFLDGRYGFIIAVLGAYYHFLTYAKLWEMGQKGLK